MKSLKQEIRKILHEDIMAGFDIFMYGSHGHLSSSTMDSDGADYVIPYKKGKVEIRLRRRDKKDVFFKVKLSKKELDVLERTAWEVLFYPEVDTYPTWGEKWDSYSIVFDKRILSEKDLERIEEFEEKTSELVYVPEEISTFGMWEDAIEKRENGIIMDHTHQHHQFNLFLLRERLFPLWKRGIYAFPTKP